MALRRHDLLVLLSIVLTLGVAALALGQLLPEKPYVTGSVTDGIRLTATSDKQTFLVGDDVTVTVTIQNRRKSDMVFVDSSNYLAYPAKVINPFGQEMYLYPGMENAWPLHPARRVAITLHPGEIYKADVWLSRCYDFRKTGSYTAVLARHFPASQGTDPVTVIANPVTFEIVDAPTALKHAH